MLQSSAFPVVKDHRFTNCSIADIFYPHLQILPQPPNLIVFVLCIFHIPLWFRFSPSGFVQICLENFSMMLPFFICCFHLVVSHILEYKFYLIFQHPIYLLLLFSNCQVKVDHLKGELLILDKYDNYPRRAPCWLEWNIHRRRLDHRLADVHPSQILNFYIPSRYICIVR